jgi:hypothetical protein
MSQNQLISIGVGIVAAVAGYFTFGWGTYAVLAAFSLASAATMLALGPDEVKGQKGPQPDKLEVNLSSESTTIPVIFGTSRVAANYIYVGFDQFESKEIKQQAQSKGAEDTTIGFTYTFPLAYGICMGEIDRLIKVVGSPGLKRMTHFGSGGIGFTDGEHETFDIIHQKESNGQTVVEGGSCDFYPGSDTQGNEGTQRDNVHRGVCWVNFPKYRIDGSTSPRSLLFTIRRLPRVKTDDGNSVPNFPKRAGTSDDQPEFFDANPAAVAWEVFTNKVWGKGQSSDLLDIPSFRTAANYYEANRLGISTAMGRMSLASFVQRLRDVFGLYIWWDGEKLRAQCIWDRSVAYTPRPRIQADDVIGVPAFNRPAASGSYNEIRLEFTNRQNNFQTEIATAMDLAHVETVGGVRTQTIDGNEIGTRRAAERIAANMLRQLAYPPATCQVKIRRTFSGLQPAGFVEFVWDEWRETGVATTYWRVVDIEDDDQGGEGITVTLMEDYFATARDGVFEDGDWEDPDPAIDSDDALDNEDLALDDLAGDLDPGSIEPVVLHEPNIWVSAATRRLLVLPTREQTYVTSVNLAWSNLGELTTEDLRTSSVLPINGLLMTDLTADGPKLARGAANEFQIELFHLDDAPAFEAATGLVIEDTDHFSALTANLTALMLIDGEIFRIGFAEQTSPGVITVRTYMRAELGSVVASHTSGAICCLVPSIRTSNITDIATLPTETPVEIYLTPNTADETFDVTTVAPSPEGTGITLAGNSLRPFAPELYSAERTGDTWTVKVRPRLWVAGAGYRPALQDDFNAFVTDLTGLSIQIRKTGTGGTVTVPAGTSFADPPFTMPTDVSIDSLVWTPDDGEIESGIITLTITFDSSPSSLDIWGVRDGFKSTTPLTVSEP